jgi:membrane protein YdbS with pleckstrin-like domain
MSDRAAEPVGDGTERRLDPREIPLQRLVGRIATATISTLGLAGLAIALLLAEFSPPAAVGSVTAWIVATGGLWWWLDRWPAIDHRHASYIVDPDGIEIRRGVLWRARIRVPTSRIQHTDVSQGPLQRRFGLGTLAIYTAGTSYARVDLAGLDHGLALRIRDHLLPTSGGDAC